MQTNDNQPPLMERVKALILEADLTPFKGDRAKLDAWVREHFPDADFDTINDAIGEASDEKRAEGERHEAEAAFLKMIAELREKGGKAVDCALAEGEGVNKHAVLAAVIAAMVPEFQALRWDQEKITVAIMALLSGFDRRLREILSTPMAEGGVQ